MLYGRGMTFCVPRYPKGHTWRGQGVVSFNDAIIHICSIRPTLKPPPSLRDTSAGGG